MTHQTIYSMFIGEDGKLFEQVEERIHGLIGGTWFFVSTTTSTVNGRWESNFYYGDVMNKDKEYTKVKHTYF